MLFFIRYVHFNSSDKSNDAPWKTKKNTDNISQG